jgi:hypothetical protein
MVARTLLVALALVGMQSPTRAQSVRADVEKAYPTFGVALTGPAGWMQLAGGKPGLITRWGKPNPETGEVAAAIIIEVEPVQTETAAQYAAKLAQRIGGTVDRSTVDLAGVRGYTIAAGPSPAGGVRVASTLVAKRGTFMYVVTGFESPGAPVSGALESVRIAWKWMPVEPVSKHLQSLSPPFPVFGKLSMSLPEMARPLDVKDPGAQMHLGIFDYLVNKPVMDVEMITLPPGRAAKQAKEWVSQMITEQAGLSQPLSWTDQGGRPRRWVSSPFERNSPGPARGSPPVVTVSRYAVVEVNERESALLTLQYVIGKPSERSAFEAANEAIVRSIGPAGTGTADGTGNGGSASSAPAAPRGDGSITIKRKPPRADKPATK